MRSKRSHLYVVFGAGRMQLPKRLNSYWLLDGNSALHGGATLSGGHDDRSGHHECDTKVSMVAE